MPIDPKQIQQLRAPFPKEAVQIYKTIEDESGEIKHLTGYKNQYIVERLNDVFGHENWDFKIVEHAIIDGWAYVLGRMTVYLSKMTSTEDINPNALVKYVITEKEQFGTNKVKKNSGPGEALKGAATNALDKCASLVDIGHEAYKGLVAVPEELKNEKIEKEIKVNPEIPELKEQLNALCVKHNIKKAGISALIKNVLKKEISPGDITNPNDFKKLIQHLEKNEAPF